MMKRIVLVVAAAMLTAAPAFAQHAEVGVFGAWVFSDGVSGSTYVVPGIGAFDRIDPKDAFGWGLDVGVMVGPNAEVGFIYANQPSTLQVSGTTTKDLGDMSINTYHGYFAYNWGEADAKVRPYFLGGFGATSYGAVDFTRFNGSAGTIRGVSRFSSTWGAGVKFYGSSKVGGRAGMRFTPAYIKSDAAGYWCDPYWGTCYLVGSAQYANQFDFNFGVTFRF